MVAGRVMNTKCRFTINYNVMNMTLPLKTGGCLNLSYLPIVPPPMTAKQRVVIIPGDQPEEAMEGKTLRKRKF